MQNNRLRLGQLLAFCGGLALLGSLSMTWFRPEPLYHGDAPLDGPQTGWQAFAWEDSVLGGIALAALALTVAIAFTGRGDAPRVVLLVLGMAATGIVAVEGVSPWLIKVDNAGTAVGPEATQIGAWIALVASLALMAGADGVRLGSTKTAAAARRDGLLAMYANRSDDV